MCDASGINCVRNSSVFGLRSTLQGASPVMFPPGRAKLVTRPARTGSPDVITIGTALVACFAAVAVSVSVDLGLPPPLSQ